jgi:hypothetical protein
LTNGQTKNTFALSMAMEFAISARAYRRADDSYESEGAIVPCFAKEALDRLTVTINKPSLAQERPW